MDEYQDIMTKVLAFWGALISTILLGMEFVRFYYEGVRIKVEVKGNFKILGRNPSYEDTEYIIIKVSNKGKAITTITHAWLMTCNRTTLLSSDCFFNGPCKLNEGDYSQYLIKEKDVKEKYGLIPRDYLAVVSDAAGRTFYSHRLPMRWFKRLRMKLFKKIKTKEA